MTAVAPERSTGRSAAPGPLTVGPGAGAIITALFVLTVLLFVLSLLNLVPPA